MFLCNVSRWTSPTAPDSTHQRLWPSGASCLAACCPSSPPPSVGRGPALAHLHGGGCVISAVTAAATSVSAPDRADNSAPSDAAGAGAPSLMTPTSLVPHTLSSITSVRSVASPYPADVREVSLLNPYHLAVLTSWGAREQHGRYRGQLRSITGLGSGHCILGRQIMTFADILRP